MSDQSSDKSAPLTDATRALFFTYDFGADGLLCAEGAERTWTFRAYMTSDIRTRQAVAADPALPVAVKEAFLSGPCPYRMDFEDGWLHGEMPDFRHDYSAEAHGLGRFRFAFDGTTLIGSRKQPLDSIERVRAAIVQRSRPFRTPADLVEAVLNQSLDAMSSDLGRIGDGLDGIEDRIVCDAWHNERQPLIEARRELVVVHRHMAALSNLFRRTANNNAHGMPEPVADMLDRLANRSQTLNQDGEQLQARARLLQDELMARLSAQTNQLLYVLSAMTAVLLPMSIVSGLFGMNVGGIPLGESRAGFWTISLVALGVAALVLYFVQRLSR